VRWRVVTEVGRAFGEDKVPRLASSIAFTAIFSIAPLFIVVIAVAGWALGAANGGHGHHVAEDALLEQVRRAAGSGTAETVRQLIAASFDKPRRGIAAQVVGWFAFSIGAAALFSSLQDALNAIWHVEAQKAGWRHLVRRRAIPFAMLLLIVALLLATLAATGIIAIVAAHFTTSVPLRNSAFLFATNQFVTFVAASLAFAAIFKFFPDVSVAWRDVWLGAIVTAVLFVVGEAAIATYFAIAGVTSAYGAAGSLLVALLWIYYSTLILLCGAEFTKIVASASRT
jgi:membrane protein